MDTQLAGTAALLEKALPIFQRSGPLTKELLLEPARFGLGIVPPGLQADAAVSSVCGFC